MPAFIANLLASPKTTFLGFAGAIAVIAKWVQEGSINVNDIPVLLTTLGVVLAKDAGTTGAKK